MYMVNERRPRIAPELADQIDSLREDMPFEKYVAEVLAKHTEFHLGTPEGEGDMAFMASRIHLHGWEDVKGTGAWIDKLPLGGWGEDQHPDVMAGIVIDDEMHGSLGVYLDAPDLRALRDAITDVLNDGPWNSEVDR